MVHLVRLMRVVNMNRLLIRVLLRLFASDASPVVYAVVVLPSPVCATLVPFGVALLARATPSLLLPFSSYPSSFA